MTDGATPKFTVGQRLWCYVDHPGSWAGRAWREFTVISVGPKTYLLHRLDTDTTKREPAGVVERQYKDDAAMERERWRGYLGHLLQLLQAESDPAVLRRVADALGWTPPGAKP